MFIAAFVSVPIYKAWKKKRCSQPVHAVFLSYTKERSRDSENRGETRYYALYKYYYEGKEYTAKLDVTDEIFSQVSPVKLTKEVLSAIITQDPSAIDIDKYTVTEDKFIKERTIFIDPEKPTRCLLKK